MNSSIEKYLDELKEAMGELDRSTVQDALANAEDHLNEALLAALRDDPGGDRQQMARTVIEQYGTPEEIRDVYTDIEQHTKPVFAVMPRSLERGKRPTGRFLSVIWDPGSWAACLYMVLSLLTGTLYFSLATTGLSLSVSLLIFIVGIPVSMLFLLSARALGFVEGRLVEALLGVRMPRRAIFPRGESWWQSFKTLLRTGTTWTTVLYMFLMLPLGIFYFTLIITLFSLGVSLLGAPLLQYGFDEAVIQPNVWIPFYAMPLVMAAGGLLLILTLHLAKFVASVHGRFAKAMLVS